MIDTNKVLNCNASNILRKHKNVTDEDLIRTEVFRYFQYYYSSNEHGSLLDFEDTDFEKENYHIMDIVDNYLRATDDEDVIEITDIDDITEYILRRYYDCSSKNDYDYTFLFNNLNKKEFVDDSIKKGLVENIANVDGKYYMFVDCYVLNNCYGLRNKYSSYVPF